MNEMSCAPTDFRRAALRALLAPALLTVPDVAFAEVPGVKELVAQGLYWKSKGRQDLAEQALRRALALDPGNAQARQALHGGGSTPAPARPAPIRPLTGWQALATKAAPKRTAEPARSARGTPRREGTGQFRSPPARRRYGRQAAHGRLRRAR
jgi:hypothetical protein